MYIGIDLGGTNIAAGLVGEDGTLLASTSCPTKKERETAAIVRDMAALSERLLAEQGLGRGDVRAVGIGCPGTVDAARGEVVYSNNIPMAHYPIVEEFCRHLPLPTHLENDANAAAFGEYYATARGVDSFVLMTLGTGVGSGIVLDGKIYRGFNGAAPEFGHSILVFNGEPCTCGRRGCLEAYASVTALIRDTKRAMEKDSGSLLHLVAKRNGGRVTGRTAFLAAAEGDATAIAVRDAYISYIAEGVTSVVNLLQPRLFTIGGGISREGDVILKPLLAYLAAGDFNKYGARTEVRMASLFGEAGIIGAAMAAATNA